MKQKINLQSNGRCPPLLEWAKAHTLSTQIENKNWKFSYLSSLLYSNYVPNTSILSKEEKKKVNPNDL